LRSLACPVIQVFAQQELGLAQDSGKRVIDLVSYASDEFSDFFKLYTVTCQLSVYVVFSARM
jgi:hypothetical protein